VEALKGKLLVASPALSDPNFFRTVVLMLEHSDEGALGVVLNRPSELEVSEPLPAWADVAAQPPVVFVGGPVSPSSAICLGRAEHSDDADWEPVVGSVGALDLNIGPAEVRPRPEVVRVFAGYAGWGPHQIEAEILSGGWFVVDADPDDALSPSPGDLWSDVLRRQPGRLAMFAHYPLDPSTN
jgi:putative transcriptional regulator